MSSDLVVVAPGGAQPRRSPILVNVGGAQLEAHDARLGTAVAKAGSEGLESVGIAHG